MLARPLMVHSLDAMQHTWKEVSSAMGVTDAVWFRVVAEKQWARQMSALMQLSLKRM